MFPKYLILAIFIAAAGCGGGITAYKTGNYKTLIESGWAKYNQSQFEDAQKLFSQAKNMDSTKPDAYIGCGWSLFMRQRPDSALVEFFRGFSYITTLADSVDTICGIAGSYLADGENSRLIKYLSPLDLTKFDSSFPLKNHDFTIDRGSIEIVLAQAYYRMEMYSSAEKADPNNAVYHLNQVLLTPYTYTNPEELMTIITEYLSPEGGLS
jgi:hypothetical protein